MTDELGRAFARSKQLFSMLTYHGNSKEFWARGLPKMQGTKVELGTSQFRRPWATRFLGGQMHALAVDVRRLKRLGFIG
jgi:hypothetical protein